jgi:hypothetical protein
MAAKERNNSFVIYLKRLSLTPGRELSIIDITLAGCSKREMKGQCGKKV